MRSAFKYLICCVLFNLSLFTFSQTKNSFNTLFKATDQDTTKLRLLAQYTDECDPEEILKYSALAIELANKLLEDGSSAEVNKMILKHKAHALSNKGFFYNSQGDFAEALLNLNEALKIQKELNDKPGLSMTLNNLGFMYNNHGDISKALDHYGQCLKIQSEIGDMSGIATSLSNSGLIYLNQGDIAASSNYLDKSLQILEKINDKRGIAGLLNNFGLVYNKQNNIPKALEYFQKSLKIEEEIGDNYGMETTLNNIASIFVIQGDLIKALEFFNRSLKLQLQTGNKLSIANSALQFTDSALAIARESEFTEGIRNSERLHSKIDSATGNFAEAFKHYKEYIIFRDKINNEQTQKASIKSQLKNDFDKKEAVIKEQQDKERAVAAEKDRFQQIVIWAVITGFLLVVIFAAFVFRTLKTTRLQKEIIESKQKEILDSIHYAKRIQKSLLPSEKYIERNLKKTV